MFPNRSNAGHRNRYAWLGQPRQPSVFERLHASEDGMLSMITPVAVLFFSVLVVLAGNTGRTVKEKVQVQNAADAAAITQASVAARGMNAVTLTNHMLGELTAILVMHQAFGGAELDEFISKGSDGEVSILSQDFNVALDVAVELGNNTPGGNPFASLDTRTKDELKKDGGSGDSGGKHLAWATIFDSRLTLKYYMLLSAAARVVADVSIFIPFIGEVIYWGLHATITVLVGKILQEVKALDAIEEICKLFSRVKQATRIEAELLPFMAGYSDKVVEQFPTIGARVAEESAKRNGVSLFLYKSKLELPLEKEPAPTARASQAGSEPDGGNASGAVAPVGDVADEAKNASSTRGDAIREFPDNKDIRQPPAPTPIPSPPGDDGYGPGDNISRKNLPHLSRSAWDEVYRSQWMRATYPYVRAWRKPIREAFNSWLVVSGASKWYSRWTNRYSASKVYEFRTGKYGLQSGRKPLAMYMLKEAYQKGKGRENWTTDNAAAEKLFTTLAVVHRKPFTPFFNIQFSNASPGGVVAYSQAIFYNGNRQSPGGARTGAAFQPDVGWDTLNWQSSSAAAKAYEFRNGDDAGTSFNPLINLPFITFTKAKEHPQVKLNWQAKLTPVTRLRESSPTWLLMPSDMRSVLLKSSPTAVPLETGPFRTH
jgi:hypothetical protein